MEADKRESNTPKIDVTFVQIRFIQWPSSKTYWTIMVGRISYGSLSNERFSPNLPFLNASAEDQKIIRNAVADKVKMNQLTARLTR